MLHRLMLQNALIAALAASVLANTPAIAKPVDRPAVRSDSPAATSPRPYTIEDGRSADARDAAKDAAVQPGQPTWPVNPKVLTPPRTEGSTRGGSTDNDDIWLVVGVALATHRARRRCRRSRALLPAARPPRGRLKPNSGRRHARRRPVGVSMPRGEPGSLVGVRRPLPSP